MMTASTLEIALQNQTTSNQVFCYITGIAVDNNNKLVLLQSDGKTPYYPASPTQNGSPLLQNCAIALVSVTQRNVDIQINFAAGSPWQHNYRLAELYSSPSADVE